MSNVLRTAAIIELILIAFLGIALYDSHQRIENLSAGYDRVQATCQ